MPWLSLKKIIAEYQAIKKHNESYSAAGCLKPLKTIQIYVNKL